MNGTTTLEREDQASATQPVSSTARNNRTRNNILGAIGALLFIGLCFAIALGGGDDAITPVTTQAATETSAQAPADAADEPASEPAPAESVVNEPATAAVASDEPATDDPAATTDAPATTDEPAATEEPAEEVEPAPVEVARAAIIGPDSPDAPPGAPEIYSILSGSKIFLRGVVPSAAIETQVVQSVAAIMGPDNVVSEYSIDPTRELRIGQAAPVYIADTIQFASGSAEIAPDFYPLIGIAPVMLSIQSDVVLTITGHTDNLGSDIANEQLSQARVDAVRDWIIGRGGDPERIIALGLGSADPIADNETEAGRQANRRVEFLIEGFDFTLGG